MEWKIIDTAPEREQILVYYKNSHGVGRVVKAQFLAKFSVECSYDEYGFCEYNDNSDTYFYPAGWYEIIDNWGDFSSVKFDESHNPTHWMPLPDYPK